MKNYPKNRKKAVKQPRYYSRTPSKLNHSKTYIDYLRDLLDKKEISIKEFSELSQTFETRSKSPHWLKQGYSKSSRRGNSNSDDLLL